MKIAENGKWLLLIHQLPPQPNALRVKIWRRLHQVGAVAIKQSVYALPFSDQSREDLSWILKEILEGGGDGSISEVRFLEGLTDRQVKALFQTAREEDYGKIIQEARLLLSELASPQDKDPNADGLNVTARFPRLQRRWEEIAAIDFFPSSERETAAGLLKEVEKGMLIKRLPRNSKKNRRGQPERKGVDNPEKPLCGSYRLRLVDPALYRLRGDLQVYLRDPP